MLIKGCLYSVDIKSGDKRKWNIICEWNGEDLCPDMEVKINDITIGPREPINNRVEVLGIKKNGW